MSRQLHLLQRAGDHTDPSLLYLVGGTCVLRGWGASRPRWGLIKGETIFHKTTEDRGLPESQQIGSLMYGL